MIKLYTPFICATISAIHGVLFLLGGLDNKFFLSLGNISGYSLIALCFIWIHSKRMCKWYKLSIKFLFAVSILNILYYIVGKIPVIFIMYAGVVLNIISVMCWLIFITTRNMSKAIRSACIHSET